MKYALALMAVAGIASSATAQVGHLDFRASVNGGAFATGLQTALPGQTVVVEVRFSSTGTFPAGQGSAIAGFNFNPTMSGGWTLGDSVGPATPPPARTQVSGFTQADYNSGGDPSDSSTWILGSNVTQFSTGPGVPNSVGNNGRIAPFASADSTSLYTSTSVPGLATINGNNLNRVAVGQLPGGQASFGPLFNNDGSGGDGTQVQTVAPGTFFRNGRQNVNVFRFSFTVSANNADNLVARDIVVGQLGGINNQVSMYDTALGNGARNFAWNADTTSTIHIDAIPAPGALALIGLGGLVAGRRRR